MVVERRRVRERLCLVVVVVVVMGTVECRRKNKSSCSLLLSFLVFIFIFIFQKRTCGYQQLAIRAKNAHMTQGRLSRMPESNTPPARPASAQTIDP